MNPTLLIAEDSYCSKNVLNNRYTKPELLIRYVSLLKAHLDLKKELNALESKYEKVHDNLKIFAGDPTIQTFIEPKSQIYE